MASPFWHDYALPTARDVPVFRPFMLANALEDATVSLDDYLAEWKWDGIRVQLVHAGGDEALLDLAVTLSKYCGIERASLAYS